MLGFLPQTQILSVSFSMETESKAYSLIVPLWNEAANVEQLVSAIFDEKLHQKGMVELVLVNNGSTDSTAEIIERLANTYDEIQALHLKENLNYGGGVYAGARHAAAEFICYIPGDLQVMPDDVEKVSKAAIALPNNSITKGVRVTRFDPLQTRVVSQVYTSLSNIILGLQIKDVNGLPKFFHRSLLDLLPEERMTSFLLDSQLLATGRANGWNILEVPVVFHGRREGVSSWSQKRFQVYIRSIREMFRIRRQMRVIRNSGG